MDKSHAVCGALFDLDGVLMDTESIYSEFWNAIDERFPTGVPNFSTSIKGSNLQEILMSHFPDASIRQQVSEMLDAFQQNMTYRYFPGAVELVSSFRAHGIGTALVTSSDQKKLNALIEQHPEFPSLFDVVITGDMVTHAKPHPECFLKAAQELGLDIDKCIVLEDSLKGLDAGMAAGAKVVGLATTYSAQDIADKCHIVVSDIRDLSVEKLLKP